MNRSEASGCLVSALQPSPGTHAGLCRCFLDHAHPRGHPWAKTLRLASYLSKLLPDAGAGSQGEGK